MTNKLRLAVIMLIMSALGLFSSCKVKKNLPVSTASSTDDGTEVKISEDARKNFEFFFIEGIKQRILENFDEAIKDFSHCLEIDQNSSATLFEMANIYVAKGDFQSSMLLMEKAVSANPDNKYYHLLLVEIYQQNKLYEKAANEYETLTKLVPENMDYAFNQAALLSISGKYEKALGIYEQMEIKMGVSGPISIGKQQIYARMGNKPAEYAEIEKLVQSNPTVSKYYGLLAEMYLSDKNREKALENYNKILEIDPNDGFVHLSIASYYLDGNEKQKAYEHVQTAFKNTELEFDTKAQMYSLLTEQGANKISEEQQLELLHILIETHIDDERPRALMVEYLLSKKQLEEARKQLRLVLDIKKDYYPYWERLLLINNNLSDWQSMNGDSEKALAYFPGQPMLYIFRSVGLLQQKKYDELLSVIDSGLVHVEKEPKVLSQLYMYQAEAYYNLKRTKESFDVFDKVVELDPENYMAMNNYAYYLSLMGEKLDIAERLSAKVIQANPDNATYLDTYAWVFFKKKDYGLAKFYMEDALSKVTEDSSVLVEHYGDILFFLNEKEDAIVQWKKSIEMGNLSKTLKMKISEKRYIETKEN